MRVLLFAALFAVGSFAASAASFTGQPYSEVRAKLFSDGWAPVASNEPASTRCFAREAVCAAYPEVEECAPTGSAPCVLVLSRGQERLELTTKGEALADMVVTTP